MHKVYDHHSLRFRMALRRPDLRIVTKTWQQCAISRSLRGWVYQIETGEVFAYDVGNGQFVKLAEYDHPLIETGARRRTTHII